MWTIGGRYGDPMMRGLALAWIGLGILVAQGGPEAKAQTPDEEDDRPGVAVFPLEDGGSFGPDQEDLDALRVGLQQMLLTELNQSQDLRVVERSQLREILDEQDLAEEGRVDPSTAAQMGQLVGARYMVTGSFVDLDRNFRMDARIIDVETSEILGTQRVEGDRGEMYDLVVEMASTVMEGVELPPLPGEQRQERSDREIPGEAVTLYSRALAFEERGETERAVEVYQRIVDEFPDMVEAEEALEQLD